MAIDWPTMWDDFMESAYEDSVAEQECYRLVAMFDEISNEICKFFDAMAHVFGGFVWFDAYGDVRYSTTYEDMILEHCKFCPDGPKQGYSNVCESGCMVPNL